MLKIRRIRSKKLNFSWPDMKSKSSMISKNKCVPLGKKLHKKKTETRECDIELNQRNPLIKTQSQMKLVFLFNFNKK